MKIDISMAQDITINSSDTYFFGPKSNYKMTQLTVSQDGRADQAEVLDFPRDL